MIELVCMQKKTGPGALTDPEPYKQNMNDECDYQCRFVLDAAPVQVVNITRIKMKKLFGRSYKYFYIYNSLKEL